MKDSGFIIFLKKLVKAIGETYNSLHLEHICAYASYAALFLILAFVPFLIILLTIVKITPLTYDVVISMLENFFPKSMYTSLERIFTEIYSKTGATVLTISMITALWSAGKGAIALTRGLNCINNVTERRNYFLLRITSSFYAIMLLFFVIGTITLNVFGEKLLHYIGVIFPVSREIMEYIGNIKPAITLIILTLFFMLLYKVLPNRKCHFVSQAPGAFFSAAGWILMCYAFSLYIDNFSSFSTMYGSLATIILVILWLYTCMNIFFIGGAINAILEREYKKRHPKDPKFPYNKEDLENEQILVSKDQ